MGFLPGHIKKNGQQLDLYAWIEANNESHFEVAKHIPRLSMRLDPNCSL